MVEVVVGVVLTALLGGLLVPAIKTSLDRRRERFNDSRDLLEALAAALWTYWKLAMRVAYYGREGPARDEDYAAALIAWDGDQAWSNGAEIQIQISRSKRLLPNTAHRDLDRTQQDVVDGLDRQVEELRKLADPAAWERFYVSLRGERRDRIHGLLFSVHEHLILAQRSWVGRTLRQAWRPTPTPIGSDAVRGTEASQET
jgi:hypothetical protein